MAKQVRVQMVGAGIPAYQSDFLGVQQAIAAAEGLAAGAHGVRVTSDDLARWDTRRGYVRVFFLESQPA